MVMPPVRTATREEMDKRIARFKDLRGSKEGLIDSHVPGCERELLSVIGFQPPEDEVTKVSPVGGVAARSSAIAVNEGFNLGFCRCKPGNGPLMHNHDTNETFMPISGRWRCTWNEGEAEDFAELGPLDVISFPAGVVRRFCNVTEDEPNQEHLLMVLIGGTAPEAEFTPAAIEYAKKNSTVPIAE